MKLLPITLLAAFLPIIPLEAASIDFTGIYTQDFDALPPKAFTVTRFVFFPSLLDSQIERKIRPFLLGI